MKIVVGLGNPGETYAQTRHNVGWMVLDRIADRAAWGGRGKRRDDAVTIRGRYRDLDLELVKPLTFMNLSGLAVRKVLARERAPLSDILVVVDDFALPLGRIRLRETGSAGSHNGLKSIVAEMGTQDFSRLRIGIGAPSRTAISHVLNRFDASERVIVDQVIDAAADAIEDWAREGINRTANRWNVWTAPAALPEPQAVGEDPDDACGPDPAGRTSGRRTSPRSRSADSRTDDAGSGPGSGAGSSPERRPGEGAGSNSESRPGSGGGSGPDTGTGTGSGSGSRSGPQAGDSDGRSIPDARGVVRTRTGWRKLLPGGGRDPETGRRRGPEDGAR